MEKRRDQRVVKKVPVRILFEGDGFLSFTGDLSRRGVFIQSPRPLPAGKGVNLEFERNGQRVTLAGFIVWSQADMERPWMIFPGGMGVQILNYQKEPYQELVHG